MTTETLKGVRRGSKSRSVEATSARISNGLFSLSLSAWLCCLLLGLFAWSSEFYEAFVSLPVLDQFAAVTAFALFALGFAATVREFRTDFEERWMARIVGAAGVLFLVAFAYRMTLQVDRLQNQIALKGVTSARQIAETGGSSPRSDRLQSTSPDRITTPVAGTSTTYNIGKHRTVTITEPWRWCSDRSMFGRAERGQREPCDDCWNQCSDDSPGRHVDGRRGFAFGAIGDSGSVSIETSGASSAERLSDF